MQAVKFFVDEQPFAFWDWKLEDKNMLFLNSIDADYLRYIAEVNADNLENDDKHRATTSLILTYSQGLETFFALLASAVQAPQCTVGWMTCYKIMQLKKIVNKIHNRVPVYSHFKGNAITWDSLAKNVHIYLGNNSKKEWAINEFGKLWTKFAHDYLDEDIHNEYNSIKHGMRIKQGGFTLMVGLEAQKGKRAPKENMKALGGSEYGSSYFVKERIIMDDKINFRPRHHSRNWNPESIVNRLLLLSTSINNVVSCLKCINGKNPEDCTFLIPTDSDSFNTPWENTCGVNKMNFDTIIKPEHIRPFSKDDIYKFYEQTNQ